MVYARWQKAHGGDWGARFAQGENMKKKSTVVSVKPREYSEAERAQLSAAGKKGHAAMMENRRLRAKAPNRDSGESVK